MAQFQFVIQFQCPYSVSDIKQEFKISRKKSKSFSGNFQYTHIYLPITHI